MANKLLAVCGGELVGKQYTERLVKRPKELEMGSNRVKYYQSEL